MNEIHVYDVDVSREDGMWVGVVRGVRGGATEVRRLAKLESEVVDLLAGLLDLEPTDIAVVLHHDPALPVRAQQTLRTYQDASRALEDARRAYERAQAAAADELRRADVSVRDAGTLLGLSFQRVQQVTGAR